MAYQQTKSYPIERSHCYTTSKKVLETLGFQIVRQREIVGLIQAKKTIGGKECLLNVTCQSLQGTQITVASPSGSNLSAELEKEVVETFLQSLDKALNTP